MKNLLLFVFCFFIFNSCSQREHIDCFTPPSPIYFKFINTTTGENLITNGTLNTSNFSIKDQDGKSPEFKVITENGLNAVIANVGWYNGIKNYTFDLGDSKSFKFNVTSRQLTGNCGGYAVDKVEIMEVSYIMENYFYLIKL